MKTSLLVVGVTFGAIAFLLLLAYFVGMFLPLQHVAEGERILPAAEDAVAARIRDVESQPKWRRGVKAIQVLAPTNGELHHRETGSNGTLAFRFREVERGRRFESVIADDTLPFGGRWIISLEPAGSGETRVRVQEEGTVRPFIFRTLSRYIFGHHSSLNAYLEDLAVSFNRPH